MRASDLEKLGMKQWLSPQAKETHANSFGKIS
jgi:hypothetical protein